MRHYGLILVEKIPLTLCLKGRRQRWRLMGVVKEGKEFRVEGSVFFDCFFDWLNRGKFPAGSSSEET